MSGSKKQIRTDVEKRQVERMVQFLANSAHELGCHVRDIEVGAGLKPGICTQWKARLRANHITKIRPSTMELIYKEVAKRKGLKPNGGRFGVDDIPEAEPPVMRLLDDRRVAEFSKSTGFFSDTPPPKRSSSACAALTGIIKTKLEGMSLVQLAHLLEFIETGNGNGQ